MVDYSGQLFDPVYKELGVPATFAADTDIAEVEITIIDDTRPKALPISSAVTAASSAEVRSVGPGAFARIPELTEKGIPRGAYLNAQLAFNGRSWIVRNFDVLGSPNGEDLGEVRFALKAADG
jgi:hypothetical protein